MLLVRVVIHNCLCQQGPRIKRLRRCIFQNCSAAPLACFQDLVHRLALEGQGCGLGRSEDLQRDLLRSWQPSKDANLRRRILAAMALYVNSLVPPTWFSQS